MKVFLTGGNGFLGLNIVRALKSEGHEILCLVRENSNVDYLNQFNVKTISGSLQDKRFLHGVAENVDAVIHTAGITSCKKSDIPKLLEVNSEGTKNICEAALEKKLKRVVFTSTTSTIGCANSVSIHANEMTPLSGFREHNPYGVSKLKAERYVLDAVEKGLDAVILNPSEVVGPYDYNFQWGRIVLAVAFNQLPFIPPGGGSFCHAQEVGRTHVNALINGRAGERYILAGTNVTFRTYIESIEKMLGRVSDRPGGNYWMKLLDEISKGLDER